MLKHSIGTPWAPWQTDDGKHPARGEVHQCRQSVIVVFYRHCHCLSQLLNCKAAFQRAKLRIFRELSYTETK